MAEPLPDGLYPQIDLLAVVVEPSDGLVEVLGRAPAGPAGEIAIELPDGSVWVVDHADPDRLVRLDLPGGDPAGSPLLQVAIGGDAALLVADAARPGGFGTPFGPMSTPPPGWEAFLAGRALLQLDLTVDDDLSPLTRLAAVAQVADDVDGAPVGRLLEAVVAHRLGQAAALAGESLEDVASADGAAAGLPPGVLEELADAMYPLAARVKPLGGDTYALTELARRLYELAGELWAGSATDEPADGPADAPADGPADTLITLGALEDREVALSVPLARAAVPPPPPRPWLEVIGPGHGRVHAPGADPGDWVVVLRADGLAPLARVPLERTGTSEPVATVVLPPLLGPDDVELRLVPPERAGRPATTGPGLDAVRRAVRAGRRAARAERTFGPKRAYEDWQDCARRWQEAGDRDRAVAALRRAGSRRGGPPIGADPPLRSGRPALRRGGRGPGAALLSDAVAATLDDG